MKKVSMFRNAGMCLVAAAAVGMTSTVWAEDAKPSDVVWKQIGAAPGVVGMAAVGKNLFACTGDGKLQVCDVSADPVAWTTLGDAPGGVVAMGVAEDKLYVSTDARHNGRLLTRDPVTTNVTWESKVVWEDIGHAWCLVAIAGVPGKLYAVVDTKELGSEPTIMARQTSGAAPADAPRGLDGLPWTAGVENERRPPVGALALTVVDGKFYVATKEDKLFVGNPTKPDVKWQEIGEAAGVTMLAGGDGKLFAVTKSGKLLMWAPKH